jgi:hypothetical protein
VVVLTLMIITVPNIITIISVLGVLSVLGAIALFISHVLKKESEFQEKQRATFGQYEEIIKRAHEEAAQLLEKTVATSQQLLAQTRGTNETLAEDFDRVLQTIAQKQIQAINSEATVLKKAYQDKIMQMESTIDQNTKQMIQGAESNLDTQLATFTKNLMTHASKSEQMLGEKTKEMLTQVQTEVNEYKKQKLATVDHAILELIQKTYQDILGKSIPPEIHQQLILEALEKTKKEGVFDL